MGGDERAATPGRPFGDGHDDNPVRKILRGLALLTPWGLNRRIADVEARAEARLTGLESRLDAVESAIRSIQTVRDERSSALEKRTDSIEVDLRAVGQETARLRDRALPAAVARGDALIDRLAEELEETSSLLERSLRGEPLPVAAASAVDEERLAGALAAIQPRLLESFRGSGEEISHRLDRYLEELAAAAPVLDLGCGRGELLLMLRDAGVDARGIEADPALVEGARRRGLEVVEGDLLEVLRRQDDASCGAVTAIHVFEHLPLANLAEVLSEVRRVLRPGGLLIAECPNPHSLRVGAALFWLDPTHHRPLLPETLELLLESAGFVLCRRELLHPFPAEQLLADDEGGTGAVTDHDLTTLAERVDRLRGRLDEILSGPRDFAVWAARPS
ncbi:MAG TPA: methyltransferase domain-containing protein [Chondromyces sp.]|nr:methyltransferase domain-containing protein [Chondromyces sp.]